jgi:hypothetical protein
MKIGAKVVSHSRYVTFQMAEVAVPAADVPGNTVADRPSAGTATCRHDREIGSDVTDDDGRGAP